MVSYYCFVDGADYHEQHEVTSRSATKAANQYGKKGRWEMVSVVRKRTGELLSRAVYSTDMNDYVHVYLGKRVRYYEFD